MRFYGFRAAELTTADKPDLDLQLDPKFAWALRHPQQFPVDVNRAPRELLLRIPGIGVRSVERMLMVRRHHALREMDLRRLRVAWNKARWFVVAADYRPRTQYLDRPEWLRDMCTKEVQPLLFD